MSIPIRYSRDRVKDLEDIILDLQEQRIWQARHIAQAKNVRRLQKLYCQHHRHDDLVNARAAELVLDEMLAEFTEPRIVVTP